MRFFFDILTNGQRIDDPEGMELPNLEAARAEALRAAMKLMDDPALGDDGRAEFEISDENGKVVLNLPFSAARAN